MYVPQCYCLISLLCIVCYVLYNIILYQSYMLFFFLCIVFVLNLWVPCAKALKNIRVSLLLLLDLKKCDYDTLFIILLFETYIHYRGCIIIIIIIGD